MSIYSLANSPVFYWHINALTVFVISIVFSAILLPRILLISFRKKLFDPLSERKIHRSVIPRLGGIAFQPVISFSIILLAGGNLLVGHEEMALSFETYASQFLFGFCAITLLYFVGIADDLIGVRYRNKFFVQIIGGLMLACSGLWINNLHGLFGIGLLPPLAGYPLTILVVVFIINAVNLIDGIDGLASGLSSVALIYYVTIFILRGQYAYSMLALATLGSLIPFFYYNVFGKADRCRKIFMGDTGSLTIGILLCFLSLAACRYTPAEDGTGNSFVVAFTPLLVPCFDVLRVFFHRLKNRKPLFLSDKNHIHHKLMDCGLSQSQVLLIILSTSAILTSINLGCAATVTPTLLLLINILCWTLVNVWLTQTVLKKKKIKSKK